MTGVAVCGGVVDADGEAFSGEFGLTLGEGLAVEGDGDGVGLVLGLCFRLALGKGGWVDGGWLKLMVMVLTLFAR